MPIGHYYIVQDQQQHPNEIIFEVKVVPGVAEVPEDQQNLTMDIGNSLSVIQLLYKTDLPDNERKKADILAFKKAFDQLFYIARVGLEGDNAQPELAGKALLQFKRELVDRESGKVKNKYMRELGKLAAILSIPFLLAGSLLNYLVCKGSTFNCVAMQYTANLMILWSGTMIGVWLSFAISKTFIGFDELSIIEKDRLEPFLRLVFTGVLSVIFGLLFIKGALEIKLGSLSSADVAKDCIVAFLIGNILGLNEKLIGNTLTKKTSALLNKE